MAKNLSETWVVISIGKREYAINSQFVKAVTELKHENFIAESPANFVRGVYNIFNTEIPVIDGHKIARQTSKDATKLSFSKSMTDVKLRYIAWLDHVEWCITFSDEDAKSREIELRRPIENWVVQEFKYGDTYLTKLHTRLIDNIQINMNRAARLIASRKNGTLSITECNENMKQIRAEADRRVLDGIDGLIECYTSKMSELCVVLSASGRTYALTVDAIELVVDTDDSVTSNKRTVLSAGTIKIKDIVYNVLDLTKLSKILI